MDQAFLGLTFLIVIAAVLSIFFRVLKQPTILAYIVTGVLLGPLAIAKIDGLDTLHTLSQIGITLLLFMIGLELKVKELRSVGKISFLTGIGQIVFTSLIGFVICLLLGFNSLTSIYVAIALTFSSTIIIVKLLTDKKDLNSLYGKISVGFLLVQDFFAVLALILLAGIQQANAEGLTLLVEAGLLIVKAFAMVAVIYLLSKFVFPKIVDYVSKSQEILLLFCLAWAFGFAAFVSSELIGFSIEIGGFLAGLALANSVESFQIIAKVKSIRDFFIVIFFVLLGMGLNLSNIESVILPAVLLSIFVLVGNPVIVMIIMGLQGYKKRTSFMAGLTVAQISEFSLIVIYAANQIGHISSEVVAMVTLVGIITFIISTYGITYSNYLYKMLARILSIFELSKKNAEDGFVGSESLSNHIIIAGVHRIGRDILKYFEEDKNQVLLIDFNPEIANKLKEQGYNVIFGDIADLDLIENLAIDKAKVLISTIPDMEDNAILIRKLEEINSEILTIVTAQNNEDISFMYDSNADIVISPYKLTGEIIGRYLKNGDIEGLKNLKI